MASPRSGLWAIKFRGLELEIGSSSLVSGEWAGRQGRKRKQGWDGFRWWGGGGGRLYPFIYGCTENLPKTWWPKTTNIISVPVQQESGCSSAGLSGPGRSCSHRQGVSQG